MIMFRAIKIGVGAVALLVVYGVAQNLIHAFIGARFVSNGQIRQQQFRKIGSALVAYETEHQGRLPEKRHWARSLIPHLDDPAFLEGCEDPASDPPFPCAYVFHEELSGMRVDDLHDCDVWVIEEDSSVLPYSPFKLGADGREILDRSMLNRTHFVR
jgi:hypothetical protein